MVNMGNVWDRTTEFLNDNIGAILPIALLSLLIPQAIAQTIKPMSPAESSLVLQLIGLVLIIPTLWGQLAIVALTLAPDAGRSAAQSSATRALGPAIVTMLVLFAGFLVATLPIILALVAGGADLTAMMQGGMAGDVSSGVRTFVILYGLAFVIVAMLVTVRLALIYPVIVVERAMLRSIPRSFALTRGIVWKMIGVWIVFVLVYLIGYLAVTSVVGAVFGLISPDPGQYSIGRIVVAIVGATVTTAFTLVVAAFSSNLYRAVVAAREGSAFVA